MIMAEENVREECVMPDVRANGRAVLVKKYPGYVGVGNDGASYFLEVHLNVRSSNGPYLEDGKDMTVDIPVTKGQYYSLKQSLKDSDSSTPKISVKSKLELIVE